MTHYYCKKIIENMKTLTGEELAMKKEDMAIKLDIFLLNNRITQDQYTELVGMLNAL